MNLDLFNNLINDAKENNFIQNFIKELGKFMEESISNAQQNSKGKPILEKIEDERPISISYKNGIINEKNKILMNYANETQNSGAMYFVLDKSSNNYDILKFENNKSENLTIKKDELPSDICVNSIFREIENGYVLDEVATETVNNEIIEMANEKLDEQDMFLDEQRIDNHLYVITEEINDSRFIMDITDYKGYDFEEVKFPKELLDEATTGTVFKYSNGQYTYYSRDGFERLDKIHSK